MQWASEPVSTATILVGVSELFAAWKAVYCLVTSATFKLPSGDAIGRAASRGLIMRASSIDGFLQPPACDVDARKCDVSASLPGLAYSYSGSNICQYAVIMGEQLNVELWGE